MVETAEQPKVNKRVDMNQYLLKGEKRNESWQIQSNKVFVNDSRGQRRQIRYCEGETSIYLDQQNKESKTTYLWLELGSLLVNPKDKTRNDYIQKHPHFNVKFYLLDEEAESADQLAILEAENAVRDMLNDLDKDQMEAVATVLFGMTTVNGWKEGKIKLSLFNFLKTNPDKLAKVIKDPATELTFQTSAAIKLNVIKISVDRNSILWGDTGLEIIPVPRGVNPLSEMALFLRTNEGLTTLQAIGEKVNAHQTKATKKPINRKKK